MSKVLTQFMQQANSTNNAQAPQVHSVPVSSPSLVGFGTLPQSLLNAATMPPPPPPPVISKTNNVEGSTDSPLNSGKSNVLSLSGFEVGFKIGFDGIESNVCCNNSNSVIINPAAVQEKLDSELAMNRISGPYSRPPFKHFKCSSLSLLLKCDGKFRLLHNLSYSYNEHAVNMSIPESDSKVKFSNIGHALDIIKEKKVVF